LSKNRKLSAAYSTADHELSEKEVRLQYGSLIDQAEASFYDDPTYLISMVEQATRIVQRREKWGLAIA
jgi:hypothetical protein